MLGKKQIRIMLAIPVAIALLVSLLLHAPASMLASRLSALLSHEALVADARFGGTLLNGQLQMQQQPSHGIISQPCAHVDTQAPYCADSGRTNLETAGSLAKEFEHSNTCQYSGATCVGVVGLFASKLSLGAHCAPIVHTEQLGGPCCPC